MTTCTEFVNLGSRLLDGPVRFDPEPSHWSNAVGIMEQSKDRGTLLYRIGVRSGRVLAGSESALVMQMYKDDLKFKGDQVLASNKLLGGPALYHIEPADKRPATSHAAVLHCIVPVLVPDHWHLEHLLEKLEHTNLPSDLIAQMVTLVVKVRGHERVFA